MNSISVWTEVHKCRYTVHKLNSNSQISSGKRNVRPNGCKHDVFGCAKTVSISEKSKNQRLDAFFASSKELVILLMMQLIIKFISFLYTPECALLL